MKTDGFFFFKQKTAYEIGLGIPAEPLFRSSQYHQLYRLSRNCSKYRQQLYQYHEKYQPHQKQRSEERFSRNAETDLVCRLLLEKKKRSHDHVTTASINRRPFDTSRWVTCGS